jgi:hypothetical protein
VRTLDEALVVQALERLAHGHRAGAQLGGELALHQPFAGAVRPRDDGGPDVLGGDVGERRERRRLQRHETVAGRRPVGRAVGLARQRRGDTRPASRLALDQALVAQAVEGQANRHRAHAQALRQPGLDEALARSQLPAADGGADGVVGDVRQTSRPRALATSQYSTSY